MKKNLNVGDRIKALREARGISQVKFADLVGVSPPTVSRWEAGEVVPPSEACVRFGNLAAYPENLWFWQRAGIDTRTMLSTAEQILKERGAQPSPDEIVYAPRSSGDRSGAEEAGVLIPLPAEFVPNPLSTRCLVVDEKISNPIFPIGDVIFLDESANSAQDLRPLWGEIVLVHLTRPQDTRGLRMTQHWKDGLNIGRLLCRRSHTGDGLYWAATLGPFDDADKWLSWEGRIWVGTWNHEFRAKALQTGVDRDWLRKAEAEAALQAPIQMRLAPGCRLLGRVIGWLRSPEQKLAEKERGK
jgi:DNA-binding XRE family transcriptional regulator